MTDVNDRVMLIMQTTGDSRQTFANALGINTSVISHIASKRNKPSLEMIINIVNYYKKVNLEWLLLGKGEMLTNEKDNIEKETILNKLKEMLIMNEMQYNSTKMQINALLAVVEGEKP